LARSSLHQRQNSRKALLDTPVCNDTIPYLILLLIAAFVSLVSQKSMDTVDIDYKWKKITSIFSIADSLSEKNIYIDFRRL